jgi:hypothetical protein
VAGSREYPRQVPEPEYPETMLVRPVHAKGHFRWKHRHEVFVSEVLWGERIGLLPRDACRWATLTAGNAACCHCRKRQASTWLEAGDGEQYSPSPAPHPLRERERPEEKVSGIRPV